jgi:hypothetical protein
MGHLQNGTGTYHAESENVTHLSMEEIGSKIMQSADCRVQT